MRKKLMFMSMVLSLFTAAVVLAAPSVVGQSATSAPATTNISASLPAGSAGERLMLLVATNRGGGITWPSGYPQRFKVQTQAFGARCTLAMAERETDGSEGSSATITLTLLSDAEVLAVRVSGHDPATPTAWKTAVGINNHPNPPNHDPAAWGTEDTLWIASACQRLGGFTGFPTNYVNDQYLVNAGVSLGFSSRLVTAASEDPGEYPTSSYREWVAVTLAIRPSP